MVRNNDFALLFRIAPFENKRGMTILAGTIEYEDKTVGLPRSGTHISQKSSAIKKDSVTLGGNQLRYELFDEAHLVLPSSLSFHYPPELQGKLPLEEEMFLFDVLLLLPEIA